MRQSKYLLAGGPADGRWTVLPPLPALRIPVARHPCAEPEIHFYYRRRVIVPGWLVPLTIYTPLATAIPLGTVLPGCIEGARLDAWPIGGPASWTWADYAEPVAGGIGRLRAAVRAENRRRLAR